MTRPSLCVAPVWQRDQAPEFWQPKKEFPESVRDTKPAYDFELRTFAIQDLLFIHKALKSSTILLVGQDSFE